MEGKLNDKNPLTIYKRQESYFTWDEISKLSGINKFTLINIAKAGPAQLLKIKIDTFIKIKTCLDVDLVEFVSGKKICLKKKQ